MVCNSQNLTHVINVVRSYMTDLKHVGSKAFKVSIEILEWNNII